LSRPTLLVGLGAANEAVARALLARGEPVVAVDDARGGPARSRAASLGIELHEAPGPGELAALVAAAARVVPSPGVPARHPVFAAAAAAGVEVVGDVELAAGWARVPIVAVTGTNGKTTVTTWVAAMLSASGRRARACGNIGHPAAAAVGEPGVDVLVMEVSSFQLALTRTFRPRVAVWLNFAADHVDAHGSLEAYAAAKARVWANQAGDDVAVVNADDPVVADAARRAPARVVTFGTTGADATVADGRLVGPGGVELVAVADLPRALPHDVANALAAAAAALEAGAAVEAVRSVLRDPPRLPHRVELVGEAGGVRWYDDSKATNPHATLAAVAGFGSVVLLAGGRNKGLDLSALAAAAGRLRAVVAIGESAGEVEAAFRDSGVPVRRAASMDDAVAAAAALARPGDAVLLSPACASFDRYRDYAERGDDFARAVRAHLGLDGGSR
jgi:UDP-N-acetylmuramoylalanine--D-glutamate ligase